eukprot:m.16770 g.16770  ORF g.16770 m.16770 type:complete len:461 (-) comp5794_c0_seq2:2445-3827(-)
MAGGQSLYASEPVSKYSIFVGGALTFNLIVGAGALSLPQAFADAGYILATMMLVLLAFFSCMTAGFVIETLSITNAMIKSGHDKVSLLNKSSKSISDFDIDLQCELGYMAQIFLNSKELKAFYAVLAVYLFGDLCIYCVAIPKSMQNLFCSASSTECVFFFSFEDSYYFFLILFLAIVGPFCFFDLTKTKIIQLFTTAMRWASFVCMILIAMIGIVLQRGFTRTSPHPPKPDEIAPYNVESMSALFGVCVYAFMCHHSLPSLLTPVENKENLWMLVPGVLGLVLLFYLLLCFTAVFRFSLEELNGTNGLYNLNFGDYHYRAVANFLRAFPMIVLSANFPIIAVTLRNNLRTLLGKVASKYMSENQMRFFFPLLAIVPPAFVAFLTQNVEFLVSYTGSYAGVAIQYVIPALLVQRARKIKMPGAQGPKLHDSWFHHDRWLQLTYGWALMSWGITTANIIYK